MTPPPLGDKFPEDSKEQFCDRNIRPGAVLRFYVYDTSPPKIKMFLILGINNNASSVGCLYINSEINPNVISSQELMNLQFRMSCADNKFLEYDSFLDCSHIYEKDMSVVREHLRADISIFKGQLPDNMMDAIKSLTASARTILHKLKIKYGLI